MGLLDHHNDDNDFVSTGPFETAHIVEEAQKRIAELVHKENILKDVLAILEKEYSSTEDFVEGSCKAIKMIQSIVCRIDEGKDVLRDVNLFLNDLPLELGRGSLNGWRTQLQYKITKFLKGE
jgi:hypothetical protein